MFLQFNSTVGKFVGYTELGVNNAERMNKDPNIMNTWRGEKDRYCTHNAEIRQSAIADKKGKQHKILISPVTHETLV